MKKEPVSLRSRRLSSSSAAASSGLVEVVADIGVAGSSFLLLGHCSLQMFQLHQVRVRTRR